MTNPDQNPGGRGDSSAGPPPEPKAMTFAAKAYAYAVVAAGAGVAVVSLAQWTSSDPVRFLIFLLLGSAASLVKLQLPGVNGAYSVSFLFLLFGVSHFTLSETLTAACVVGAIGSFTRGKKLQPVRALFNMANLALSVGAGFLVVSFVPLWREGRQQTGSFALVVAVYFLINTVLVSGILSVLERRRLGEVWEQWYAWFLPYYLVGATLVGLTLVAPDALSDGVCLVLLPLLYLLHFFAKLSERHRLPGLSSRALTELPEKARAYVVVVLLAGAAAALSALWNWECRDALRLTVYLALVVAGSMMKVRLPQMTGTISLNFVLLLVAIVELSLPEAVLMAAVAGVVQCVWKARRRPMAIQVLFNASCLALSICLAWLGGRWGVQALGLRASIAALLLLSTAILYLSNTILVSAVLSLVESGTLAGIWKNCCFWSVPLYAVGAAAAGLAEVAAQSGGWPSSLLVLPLMGLVYVSYRLQVSRAWDRLSTARA